MVDAVVTWVDGSDPRHIKKRMSYTNEYLARQSVVDRGAISEKRFADSNEIYYCLHLLRKNAPWVDRIFLVTDNQVPGWLDDKKCTELGVVMVDHKEIFSGYCHLLPTFNSISIETMMFRINGLSERFLYLNDDTFLVRAVKVEDFFDGVRPIFRGSVQNRNSLIHRIFFGGKWIPEKPMQRGTSGVRLGGAGSRLRLRQRIRLYHAPHPFNRKKLEAQLKGCLEDNAKYRFRDKSQFTPAVLHANVLYEGGDCRIVDNDCAYFHPEEDLEITRKTLREALSLESITALCIQNLEAFDQPSQSIAFSALDRLLEKSRMR